MRRVGGSGEKSVNGASQRLAVCRVDSRIAHPRLCFDVWSLRGRILQSSRPKRLEQPGVGARRSVYMKRG